MIKNYLQIPARYLKIQKKRTAMTIIGIVLSTALIAAVGTLGLSLWDKMYKDTMKNEGAYQVSISSDSKISAEKIKNNVSVLEAGTVAELGTGGKNLVDRTKNTLTEEKEFDPNGYKICAYDKKALEMWPILLAEGSLPKSSDEIIIGNETLPYLKEKVKVGDKISIDIQADQESTSRTYTVVGFLDSNLNFSRRMEGITFYDANLSLNKAKFKVYINFKDSTNVRETARKLLTDLGGTNGKELKASYNERVLRFLLQSDNTGYNVAMLSGTLFLGLLVVFAMSAVIYNIFNIALLERITQFGLLRCLGATEKQIRKLVFKEAAILGTIGIPAGILIGTYAIKILVYVLAVIVPNLPYGKLELIISPYIIVISAVLSLLSIYISAFGPARKAGKTSPLDAIRNTANLKKEKWNRVSSGKFAKRLFGAKGWIARKNLGRNRKRFSITVFSMVISIVLFIVFSSIIDLTYKTGIDDSDNEAFHFQISHKDNRGDVKLAEEDFKALSSFNEVDKIYKLYYRYFDAKESNSVGDEVVVSDDLVSSKLKEFKREWFYHQKIDEKYVDFDKSQIVGLSNENLKVLNKYLIQGEINTEKMSKEKGVLIVNTGFSYNPKTNKRVIMENLNVKVGDTVRLKVPQNDKDNKVRTLDQYKEYKVQGILKQGIWGQKFTADGGLNIYTTEDTYKELTRKDRNPDYLAIKIKDTKDSSPVRAFLTQMIKKYPDFLLRDREAEMKENRQYNLVISIFVYGFFAVIAAIGCVNIVNTISTNITLRTRELSILRAIGMTRGEISTLVRLECIFYSLAAITIGDLLGVAGSFLLYKMFCSAVEIEWSVPWIAIIAASIGTIGVTMIAGYFPVRRVNKMVIVEGVRNEE